VLAHSVSQRAARWLLITHDRAGRDEFPPGGGQLPLLRHRQSRIRRAGSRL